MTEYILLFAALICVFLVQNRGYISFLLVLICVLIGFRSITVGTDTINYCKTISLLTLSRSSWEGYVIFPAGFAYLCYFFKEIISVNPMDLIGVVGIIYVLSYYVFIRKYACNKYVCLALFILFGSYFIGYNLIRQSFALSIMLLVYSFVNITNLSIKQMILLEFLTIIVAYLFHEIVYILVLIPILAYPRILKYINKRIVIVLLLISYILCILQIGVAFTISFLDYTSLSGKLINYLARAYVSRFDYSIVKLTALNVAVLFLIIKNNTVNNIFMLSAVGGVVFLNLFGNIVMEMVRVYEMLMVFGIIAFANFYSEQSRIIKFIIIMFFSILYFNTLIKGYGGIIPYEFR